MSLYTKIRGNVGYETVGSPTMEDGIATGFSASDYYKLDTPFAPGSSTWEILVKVKVTSFAKKGNFISFGLTNTRSIQVGYTTSGTINTYISSNGTSLNISNGDTSTEKLSVNTWYYVLTKFTGISYEVYVSEDKENWTNFITVNSATPIWQGAYLTIGYNFPDYPEPMTGYIDFNETHISIGDLSWFGINMGRVKVRTSPYLKYTVVGNPTRVNGVFSNFSASNRLDIGSFDVTKPWKMQFKFNITSIPTSAANSLIGVGTSGIFNIRINQSGNLNLLLGNTTNDFNIANLTGTTTVLINTDYWAQVEFTGSKYELFLSTNGSAFTSEGSITTSAVPNSGNPISLRMGDAHSGHWYLRGSLDLNETWIKTDGKLLFHGGMNGDSFTLRMKMKEDEDYRIENGQLLWANPWLYLQSTGTQYINTGMCPGKDSVLEGKFQFTDITNQSRVLGNSSDNSSALYSVDLYINGSGKWAFTSNDGSGLWVNTGVDKNLFWHTYKFGAPLGYFYLDDVRLVTVPGTQTNTSNQELYLYCRHYDTTTTITNLSKVKQSYFKLYNNGELVQHLVPVPQGLIIGNYTVPSNGMFDIITQTFFGNQGTGTFSYGKEII